MLFKHKPFIIRKISENEAAKIKDPLILPIPGVSQDNIFYNLTSGKWVSYSSNTKESNKENPKEFIPYNTYVPFCFREDKSGLNLEAYINPSTGHWLDPQKINPSPQLEQRLDLIFIARLYESKLTLPYCKNSQEAAKELFCKIRKVKKKNIRI